MMCKDAAVRYGWISSFNPFFGYKKLPESNSDYEISPFTIEEQRTIIDNLDEHWKPFFLVAFRTGLRQGEQLVLRINDVNLETKALHIRQALTLDAEGKVTIGRTKNSYSRRTLALSADVLPAIQAQVEISRSLNSQYLFCTPNGNRIQRDNLRVRICAPTLEAAGLPYRPMIQARHSFATTALSAGESPLWISTTMGHSTAKMVLEVYGKYVRNANGTEDGSLFSSLCGEQR